MIGKLSWLVSVFVLSAMLVLSLGYIQAQSQTPGKIVKWFDADGTLTDSVIAETDSGNVGIGVVGMTPNQKLDVAGEIRSLTTSTAYSAGPSTTDGRFAIRLIDAGPSGDGGTLYDTGIGGANTRFGYDAIRIQNATGYVGIGAEAARSKLDVAGAVHATAFLTDSDMRLKAAITPLTGILEKLDKIHGVSFQWNKRAESLGHSTGRREVGVIAQEVAAVLPELVTATGPENYQAVDYSKLTVVLLEAVKELKAENQSLKHRIEVLESK